MKAEIHAIILTFNEERHIKRCIESIRNVCSSILVVDSGSKDHTREIAESLGATVIQRRWVNYSIQFNNGINFLADKKGWLLRIDADEYLTPQCAVLLHEVLREVPTVVDGVLIRRQIVFLGRRIKWGGIEPNWQLRLWRAGRGICESRWMDEHIAVQGPVQRSNIEIVDENLNSLSWWTAKHNHYASREVIDIIISRGLLSLPTNKKSRLSAPQARLKRLIKNQFYNHLPGGFRSMGYFFYRYILRLGFLDGVSGYYFHVLQGFWYRTLVDAKLHEILALSRSRGISVVEAVRLTTGIDPILECNPEKTGGTEIPQEFPKAENSIHNAGLSNGT